MPVVPLLAAVPFALIGLHLVRVALRSGAVPDRLLAAFFLVLACAVPPRLIALRLTTTTGNDAEVFAWTTAGNLLIASAMTCLVAFSWKVFRADRTWAKWATAAYGAGIGLIAVAGMQSVEASEGSRPVAIAFNAMGVVSIGWAFFECCAYYRAMRRRRRLGIASPVVANRFLLWSLWTGALSLQGALQLAVRVGIWLSGAGEIISTGGDPGGPWLGLITLIKLNLAVVGPVIAVSVWLSFSPPAAYRRWLGAEETASA